ncbi:MAG TPA: hypothetical protein VMF09_07985 [Solirubrobacteraceae bacterium]|nr:hypothetical protein [Solirubrobacteraceae bacterium]
MPRIIVTTDAVSSELTHETPVLLDEHVHSVHLSTSHAATQLVERLAWAVRDAESAEGAGRAAVRAVRPLRVRPKRRTGVDGARRAVARAHARGAGVV